MVSFINKPATAQTAIIPPNQATYLRMCVSARTPKKKKYPVSKKLIYSFENNLKTIYKANSAHDAIIGKIAASRDVIFSGFCNKQPNKHRRPPKHVQTTNSHSPYGGSRIDMSRRRWVAGP